MSNTKAIKLFYTIYSLYTILIVLISDYDLSIAVAGIASIWICYFVYKFGNRSIDKKYSLTKEKQRKKTKKEEIKSKFPLSNIGHWSKIKYIFALAISLFCSVVAARYYTGKNITSVLSGFTSNGSSAYYSYQQYFANNNINSFSVSKIPYILMLAYITIIMIWGYLGILLENKKIKPIQLLFLIGIASSYLYFGVARGTNFESFVFFITLSYCLLQKMQLATRKKKKRYFICVIVLAVFLVSVFRFVVANRGIEFGYKITDGVHFDGSSLIAQLFPTITNIAVSLFGYIGFGIYTSGVTIMYVLFGSIRSIIASIIPLGYNLFFSQPLRDIVDAKVNIGVKWFPDFINLIYLLGIPMLLFFIFLLGRLSSRISQKDYPLLLKNALNIVIFIEMLSLPVGNFLVTSSSNKIMIAFIVIWLLSYIKTAPIKNTNAVTESR